MNEEHSRMAMDSIGNAAMMVQHGILQTIGEYGEASAIYRPRVFRDGNEWCALYGDNIQEGVAGFGAFPAAAISNFNAVWNGRLPNVKLRGDAEQ